MSTELLPLFPLNVVLFPGMALPLHIFEPRYKQMIRRCLEEKLEFGVLLAREEGLAEVGCSARIVQVVKEYDDGRMDILTEGQDRFRLLRLFEDLPYFQGSVEPLPDTEEAAAEQTAFPRLQELYVEAFRLIHEQSPPDLADDPFPSFRIAGELPLSLDFKQEVLEQRSEIERQDALLQHLEGWLAQLKRTQRAKAKAAGNGHGR